jgi:hypothetical protein
MYFPENKAYNMVNMHYIYPKYKNMAFQILFSLKTRGMFYNHN